MTSAGLPYTQNWSDNSDRVYEYNLSTREMIANDSISSSSDKPLPRIPAFVDSIHRGKRWLFYHLRLQKFEGYHFGTLCCAVVSGSVMVVNLTLTIWASRHYGVRDGLGTIREGSCSETKNIAMWIHLAINVLSTLLLGASNYTMQCLASPTREDINRAHRQNVWLDIGTPSIRNLLRISRFRISLWWLVAISSVPLHLMYNSAVFTTLSAQEYNVFSVTPNFLTGAPFDISEFNLGSEVISASWDSLEVIAQTLQDNKSSLQNLASEDCIATYAAGFVSSRANVLVVSSFDSNTSNSILTVWSSQINGASDTSPWFCLKEPCDTSSNVKNWNLEEQDVGSCLSETVEEHCQVQFSGAIMMLVIICNLCKMLVMGYISWKRPTEPLVTVGDAIASFLDQPDLTTIGNCLAGKERFERANPSGPIGCRSLGNWGQVTMRCNLKTSYWFRAVSMKRWTLLSIL